VGAQIKEDASENSRRVEEGARILRAGADGITFYRESGVKNIASLAL
jgi:hypothetical protein